MKKYFYSLTYHYIDLNGDHYFQIGYFSSSKMVKKAIEDVQNKPGFRETDGVFEVSKFAVCFFAEINEKSGLTLYELSHEYLDSDGFDNFTVFGVYATQEEAENKQKKESKKMPFKDYPNGFCIADIQVDLCGWMHGFSFW